MKQSTLMMVLTGIIIVIACFGKYVESNITKSATTILEDRLKPAPMLSHTFDYYGTTVQDVLTETATDIKTIQAHKDEIMDAKIERDTLWTNYKSTYLVESEAKMVAKVDKEMEELDEIIEEILTTSDTLKAKRIIKSDEFNEKINTTLNDINWLLDLQTEIGQEETIKMMGLLKNFSNFMIGALALAFVMLGSILFQKFRKEPIPTKPVRKTTTKKKPITKKPPTKK
jgi:hypothetical protein